MIDISRYHEMRYRASTIFLKQCRIQNKARRVYVMQGDEYAHTRDDCLSRYVHPQQRMFILYGRVHLRDDFLSRYVPLNFIKKQRADDTRCLRISCSIRVASTILSLEWMCAQAINQILTTRQKEQYIRCEVWLSLRTRQPLCSEVIKNGIREVACA